MEIGEKVWYIVVEWDYFLKDTIGKQLVRYIDSLAVNLSEGLGRYNFKEATHFSYSPRSSLYELKTWLIKANNPKLISNMEFVNFQSKIYNIWSVVE